MSVSSSSRGHEGKDLELSSEVFLVSPAPHDLIGSDTREITVPLEHRDPSRHGIRPTGTLHSSLRHHKELPAGPHRGSPCHLASLSRTITLAYCALRYVRPELGTTRHPLLVDLQWRHCFVFLYLSLPGCTDPGLVRKTNKKRKQRSDRSFTTSKW